MVKSSKQAKWYNRVFTKKDINVFVWFIVGILCGLAPSIMEWAKMNNSPWALYLSCGLIIVLIVLGFMYKNAPSGDEENIEDKEDIEAKAERKAIIKKLGITKEEIERNKNLITSPKKNTRK